MGLGGLTVLENGAHTTECRFNHIWLIVAPTMSSLNKRLTPLQMWRICLQVTTRSVSTCDILRKNRKAAIWMYPCKSEVVKLISLSLMCSPDGINILEAEYEGGDISGYMDSSLYLPDESVTSEDSNSPGMLSSDEEESLGDNSVSWTEDPSSGMNDF